MSHRRPAFTDHDGFLMPKGFPVENFTSSLDYRPQAGDIFVSTYPKCGTTWMQHIVYLILHRGKPLPAGRTMTDDFPHLEEVGREFVEKLPEPRCIKTHLPLAMTPMDPAARYVYVARNPFDCAVSFFHHTRGFVKHYDFADGTFGDYFECFVTGEVDFGDYFDNLVPWYERHGDDNMLFLTYEQMKADPRAAIVQVATFLGPEHEQAVADTAILDAIQEHSSFGSMKKDQTRWASKRPDDMPDFIRKGQVGDWANHFSAEQARRLAARFDERTAGTDLAGLWPEILAAAREA